MLPELKGHVMTTITVLVDAENVDCSLWPSIANRVRNLGKQAYVRIFGDFSERQRGDWINLARDNAFEVNMQLGHNNACDIAIAVAAMDLLHQANLETICLVASDADYTPLIHRLRKSGVVVHGIGESKAPMTLRKACTSFTVVKKAKAQPAVVPKTTQPRLASGQA